MESSEGTANRRETNIAVRAGGQRDRLRQRLPSDCAGSKQYPQEKKPYPRAGNASGGQSMTEPAEATTAQEINHAAQQAKAPKSVRTG